MATRWGGFLDAGRPVRRALLRHRAARGATAWTRSSGCCSRSPGRRSSTPGDPPDRLGGQPHRRVRRHLPAATTAQLAGRRTGERSTPTSRTGNGAQRRGRPALVRARLRRGRAWRSTRPARRRWSRCTWPARACGAASADAGARRRRQPDALARRSRSRCRTGAHDGAGRPLQDLRRARPTATCAARAAACVVLKRLSDALADGDRILAVIRGIGRQPGRPEQRADRAERAGAGGA